MAKPGLVWAEFAAETGAIANDIAGLVERYGFGLVGTIRRDGTPRISAVETHLVNDDLMVVMIPRTRKASDVRRDDRITMQSPVLDAGAPGAEYKLHGRAAIVNDAEARGAVCRAIEARSGWRPEKTWLFLSVLVSEATHFSWSADGGCDLRSWKVGERVERRMLRLDARLGGYRSD